MRIQKKQTRSDTRKKTQRLTLCALLTAMMLILGYVESLIPFNFGIPGIKLGLSNSVLIFAVYMLSLPTAFLLMLVKVLLSALLFGGGFLSPSTVFALAGGCLSVLVMGLLHFDKGLWPIVVSMAGGVSHGAAQVAVYMFMNPGSNLFLYMGVLMLVGMGTGAVTGFIGDRVMRHMKTLKT